MKQSLFTIALADADGATIFYNTLTQALATCENPNSPTARKELLRAGFFVEAGADETSKLVARYEKDCATSENFCLAIAPTLECNFACPYCYERTVKRSGTMSTQTQAATVAFIKRNYRRMGARKVKIVWYGGEPLLGLPVIKNISAALAGAGIPLEASMISNASLITSEVAYDLAACHITHVSTTLDGVGATHDAHRPERSGKPTYDAIKQGLRALVERNIQVSVLFNEDRTNSAEYEALRADLAPWGITDVTASQVFDYCGCLDKTPDFSSARYSLFTDPKEFAHKQYVRQLGKQASDDAFAQFMAPLRLYCSRQVHTYFVIDEKGQLYECDGDIGHDDRVLGSVFNDAPVTHAPYNPYSDPLCATCAFIPLCLGNCRWTRACIGESCAPQKAIIDEILHDWRAVLEQDARDGSVEGGMKAAELLNEALCAPISESKPAETPEETLGEEHTGTSTAAGNAEVRILRAGTPPDFDSPTPYVLWL